MMGLVHGTPVNKSFNFELLHFKNSNLNFNRNKRKFWKMLCCDITLHSIPKHTILIPCTNQSVILIKTISLFFSRDCRLSKADEMFSCKNFLGLKITVAFRNNGFLAYQHCQIVLSLLIDFTTKIRGKFKKLMCTVCKTPLETDFVSTVFKIALLFQKQISKRNSF